MMLPLAATAPSTGVGRWHVSLIGAVFYVEVSGIIVDPSILGRSISVGRDDVRYRIDLPSTAGEFTFHSLPQAMLDPPDPRDYVPRAAVVAATDSLAEVRVVQVVANAPSMLSIERLKSSEPGQKELHDGLLHNLREAVLDLAEELSARLNLDVGQVWIAPRGDFPRIVNMVELIDLDVKQSFRVLIGSGGVLRVVGEETVLNEESVRRLEAALQGGPPMADELMLVEARHLVEGTFPVAAERSVLLAAIALELRIKRGLSFLADTSERVAALDLLMNNFRDWSMSVHGLFMKALPVFALGGPEGLGEAHRNLGKRVQRLFESRNTLAHAGAVIPREEATTHVQTASEAFDFIAELEQARRPKELHHEAGAE